MMKLDYLPFLVFILFLLLQMERGEGGGGGVFIHSNNDLRSSISSYNIVEELICLTRVTTFSSPTCFSLPYLVFSLSLTHCPHHYHKSRRMCNSCYLSLLIKQPLHLHFCFVPSSLCITNNMYNLCVFLCPPSCCVQETDHAIA